ncbi:MAG: tRNA (adenosine(37)-N6)-threonylcarbamoyltransferase complex ATPase subunit type 1 TsaE [Ferruginibacter sp.]
MVVDFKLEDIENAAQQFLAAIGLKKVIAFHGEMGAGKTTFIHAVCNELKVEDSISSPTFSIINEYSVPSGASIFHMDLYRLKDEEEAITAGVEDALYSGDLCFVEWPEKTRGIFPTDTVHCYLTSISDNERKLKINL